MFKAYHVHVGPSAGSVKGHVQTAAVLKEHSFVFLFFLQIQGAIMVASLFQVLIGFSGLMGFLLKYIGPLSIAPTIALAGLALFDVATG